MNFTSPDFARRVQALAPAYLRFISTHSVHSTVGELVHLYGSDEIEERNETHEVAEYIPDYVCIGNDSGDYEFLLGCDGGETVYREDPGNFHQPTFVVIHRSFSVWLASGCPLPKEKPYPIPDRGCLWLLSAPAAGMKDMFRLKKLLEKDWSIPQMNDYVARVPAILDEKSPLIRVHLRIKELYPDLRNLLGFSETVTSTKIPLASFSDV